MAEGRMCLAGILLALASVAHTQAQELPLPPRPPNASPGSQIKDQVLSLTLDQREEEIFREIRQGNVPSFLRKLIPVPAVSTSGLTVEFFATPDYLAVGSDEDYFRMPMTPMLAQSIADMTSTTLPTRKMVDLIYAAADVKRTPAPIPPSPDMVTVPVFWQHELLLRDMMPNDTGQLIAGHKKDVVLSPQTAWRPPPKRVCIYGWHQPDGKPIQPLSTVHKATWVDYSHGIRLVAQTMVLEGVTTTVASLLQHPVHHRLLSDEGPFDTEPRYP